MAVMTFREAVAAGLAQELERDPQVVLKDVREEQLSREKAKKRYGVVIEDAHGKPIAELSRYLGHRTNNFAEYSGLVAALTYVLEHKHSAVRVLSDSELMVRQMNGVYKVRSPELRPLYEEARRLSRQLQWFRIEHVRREKNAEADRLANQAMDRRI